MGLAMMFASVQVYSKVHEWMLAMDPMLDPVYGFGSLVWKVEE
jgi:hypothetical protein